MFYLPFLWNGLEEIKFYLPYRWYIHDCARACMHACVCVHELVHKLRYDGINEVYNHICLSFRISLSTYLYTHTYAQTHIQTCMCVCVWMLSPGGGGGGGTQVQRGPHLSYVFRGRRGLFLRPPHVRDFVKEGYFFVSRCEVWGLKSPYNPRNIRGSDAE